MFTTESEEARESDRLRVISEIIRASLGARHAEIMRAYGLPENYFAPAPTGDPSPMRGAGPRLALPPPQAGNSEASGPLRSDALAGYRRRVEGGKAE